MPLEPGDEEVLELARATIDALETASSFVPVSDRDRFRSASDSVLRALDDLLREAQSAATPTEPVFDYRAWAAVFREMQKPTTGWGTDAAAARELHSRLWPCAERWKGLQPELTTVGSPSIIISYPLTSRLRERGAFTHLLLIGRMLWPLWRRHPELKPDTFGPRDGPS